MKEIKIKFHYDEKEFISVLPFSLQVEDVILKGAIITTEFTMGGIVEESIDVEMDDENVYLPPEIKESILQLFYQVENFQYEQSESKYDN
jgi:hypothetical protein